VVINGYPEWRSHRQGVGRPSFDQAPTQEATDRFGLVSPEPPITCVSAMNREENQHEA